MNKSNNLEELFDKICKLSDGDFKQLYNMMYEECLNRLCGDEYFSLPELIKFKMEN
ncbi:hypothetical protein Q2T46_15725 [Thermoanaerobacterium sp. CMT5567-10]|uniref:hypothetical protein n=1 Tax=Thermoanaerobacterium sp. CMT5567-10 TaxID=3061989 RepID=UPI00287FC96F|nr:hypothetical protein [Thermoanaerobacterium sp. CMT5567-10]WLY85469.1 hypothetical protein Q2T46_15725 [Thermoanaerobacterium sp. CMT5567-10]